ncbi:Scr1 family TA system antitoxin-like transcriptional regulator [Streptomyces cellulosae]
MTAVEAESGGVEDEMDEPGWEVDPDDEWGVAVITTVGRQVKLRREVAGLRVPDFGRALGGRAAWQGQLQRLLDVAQLHHVVLQVMPTDCETHSGLDGRIELLKFDDGTAMGRSDGAFNGRPTSDPRQLRILELRYGTIRAQALTPRESLAFVRQLLGEA